MFMRCNLRRILNRLVRYLWGQFLPRPSVALIVIFDLESPTLEGKPSSSYLIRDDQWLKSTTSLVINNFFI